MSKKSYIVIPITLFIVFILLQFAYSTTFRISSIEDRATLITVTQSESSSSGSSSSSQSSGGNPHSPIFNLVEVPLFKYIS